MATYTVPEQNLTYNLPDEGTTFRAIGDQGDAVYKVVDGKLTTLYSPSYIANTSFRDPSTGTTYNAGDISTNPRDVEWLDKSYTGTATSRLSAFDLYKRSTGLDASALPEFNMADINTVLGRTGGVLPKISATQTVAPNNPNAAVVTSDGKVVSPTAPAPQPGAITPTQGYTNPNVANPTTGVQQAPAGTAPSNSTPTNAQYPAQIANQGDATQPSVPIGQTQEQMQNAIRDSGQQPAAPQAPAAPYSQTNPNQVINQTTGQTAGAPQINQAATQAAVSSYTGPSIVDYLNSLGQPSDYASRARLAAQMGISNYSGTAEQNTKLLDTLRMGQASAAPQVQTTTPTPPNLPSANVNGNLLGQYGVQAPDPSQSPMLSFVDSYKQILSQFGLMDIKKQFDSVQKEYDTLQNELNDKISDINDDPWLSEGVRRNRIEKMKERYEGKTSILTNKLKLYDSLYEQGVDEAKWVAGQAYQQYQFAQAQQLKLYELAQKQLEAQIGTADLQEYQFAKDQGYKGSFLEYQKEISSAAGGLTPAQINGTINQIAGSFDNEQIVKDYNTILSKKLTVDKIISSGLGGPGDLAIVYEFMKALDPTSVVRETEYGTAAKSGNIFLGAMAQFNGYLKESGGFLPPNVRTSFQSIINSKMAVQKQLYDNLYSQYEQRIKQAQSGGYNSLTDYSQASGGTIPSGGSLWDW